MKGSLLHIVLILMLMAGSCTPPEEPVSLVPELNISEMTPLEVTQFDNEVLMTLEYQDMDGDLGSADPDENTLWVKDSRLQEADTYHVPPIAPQDNSVSVSGTLNIKLRPLFLLGNGDTETVFFTVRIRDRAGNWSEPRESPIITIRK